MLGAGRTRINREARVWKDARSDGWCVYDCQTVGENLTIPSGLGPGESDAQTKKEKPKDELAFQHHFSGRRERERQYLSPVGGLSVDVQWSFLSCQAHLDPDPAVIATVDGYIDPDWFRFVHRDDPPCPNPRPPPSHPRKSVSTRAAPSSETGGSPGSSLPKSDPFLMLPP